MSDGRHSGDDGTERGSTWFSQPAGGSGDGDDTSPTGTPQTGEPDSGAPKGRIRQQDGSTTPREPSLAEKRAREQKLRADREAVRLKEARSKKTKRVLIGTGATIGVVALIAGIYAASSPDEEIVAQCVDNQTGVVVPDEECAGAQTNGQVSDGGGGFAFVPIFLGGGGRQYHYNYGSTGSVGQVATGGTVSPPPAASKSGTTVRSGTSGSTISRGGLGVGGSSSSSGSSGSSSGS